MQLSAWLVFVDIKMEIIINIQILIVWQDTYPKWHFDQWFVKHDSFKEYN
jgi:hypothetical protein